jgi:hypothetical protein
MRGDLGHTTFETVRGSSSRPALDFGRPAPKAAPRLARARMTSMGKPGLCRFCAGNTYRARRQTVRWGDPVRASATPPRVHEGRRAQTPVPVGKPPSFFDKRPSRIWGCFVWFENDPRSPSQKLVPFGVLWGSEHVKVCTSGLVP